jgi:hypothetical protein
MLKHHNRLLIVTVFALLVGALSVATSEAGSFWASSWGQSAPSATKPRVEWRR